MTDFNWSIARQEVEKRGGIWVGQKLPTPLGESLGIASLANATLDRFKWLDSRPIERNLPLRL
jgi:hypothetical protein